MKTRCQWCGNDPLYVDYHDNQWGVPVLDDQLLYGKLVLDGAQAGLSWITILRKQDGYFRAFDQFDPEVVARYDKAKIAALMQESGIVRNQAKIRSAVKNAQGVLKIREELGSFSQYLWGFVQGKPVINAWTDMAQIPSTSPEAEAMSKGLKKWGFSFVGPTICYAFMQAVGMVNDHTVNCFRYQELTQLAKTLFDN
jgi:DNA-3-methyladenine glycosylase I